MNHTFTPTALLTGFAGAVEVVIDGIGRPLLAIAQAMVTSFKKELLQATHNFNATGGHTFKIALYASSATLDASTMVYTTSGEVTGTGYTAGGNTLTNVDPAISGTTAFTDFADTSWGPTSTITARGGLVYNSTSGNKAVVVLDFGIDFSSAASPFAITFPVPAASTAIIRLA